jgi:hypothetical protein
MLMERLRWRRRGIEASDAGITPDREHDVTVRLERASSSETSLGSTPPWRGMPVRLMAMTRLLEASQVIPEKLQWLVRDDTPPDADVSMSQSVSKGLLRALRKSGEDLSFERAYKSFSSKVPAETAVTTRSARRRRPRRRHGRMLCGSGAIACMRLGNY